MLKLHTTEVAAASLGYTSAHEVHHARPRSSRPARFSRVVEPFLLARECENALPLGIARSFVELATHDGLMFSVESGAAVVAVAVKSPKRNLVITDAPELALRALAAYLDTYAFPVPGVSGPATAVREFATAWTAATGATMSERMKLQIFELRALPSDLPTPPSGSMRAATLDEAELVEEWVRGFIDEATHDTHEHVRERVARMIGAANVALWIDELGQPVSMAAILRRSPRGSTISWVYTPPDFRRRGYASACVAELSRRELSASRSFCTLYADQANSASNAIYLQLGYVPVCDALDIAFHEC